MGFYTRTTKESPAKPNRLARDQTEPGCQRGSGRLRQAERKGFTVGFCGRTTKELPAKPNRLARDQTGCQRGSGTAWASSAPLWSALLSSLLSSAASAPRLALLCSTLLSSGLLGSAPRSVLLCQLRSAQRSAPAQKLQPGPLTHPQRFLRPHEGPGWSVSVALVFGSVGKCLNTL